MLLILERELSSFSGHHHTQIAAIRGLLPNQQVCVITTRSFKINSHITDYQVLPILPAKQEQIRAEIANSLRLRKAPYHKVAQLLQGAIEKLHMGPNDRLVVPSCRSDYLRALLVLYTGPDVQSLPPARVRLLDIGVVKSLPKADQDRLKSLMLEQHIFVYTETQELAEQVTSEYNLSCSDQFILPVSVPLNTTLTDPTPPADGIYRIACLGQLRRGKGSFDIPEILAQLQHTAALELPGIQIKIQVQAAAKSNWRYRRFLRNVQRSEGLNPNVTIEFLPAELSPAAFVECLESAHVALLPYWVSRYGKRGSGMVTDSVLARKPIVHTRGLSMSKYLNSGNAIAAESPEQFASALVAVAKDWHLFRKGAEDAAKLMEEQIQKAKNSIMGSDYWR